eukprot:CAMPEP_0176315214 /NCGR_PEP_ID=MMETSP0121_2-20121125/68082_1 /TAXON_ID=160619 /ORGANISM="Kryptoperidinium foliaceum, Strain CCMP 1326" /LENGTH=52 /DNA_ID=CAMNT_0017657347 /DNA_START=1 /DNA_END=156 /DNA_ORIENTATION=+
MGNTGGNFAWASVGAVGVMPQRGGGVQSPSQPTSATRRVQQGSGQVLRSSAS